MNTQRGSATVWIVVAATLVVVVGGLVLLAQMDTKKNGATLPLDKAAESDWTNGKKDAAVTMIEYADFQCPACGTYAPIILQLEEQYKDRVQFVFRHFPLRSIHMNAEVSSRAAEAAGLQGKFIAMRDKLYATQSAWSQQTDPTTIFTGYAQELGLNVDQFKSDLNSQKVRDHINLDVESGQSAGVNSTPTFYLAGKKLNNPGSVESFKQAIDNALATAPVVSNSNTSGNTNAQ